MKELSDLDLEPVTAGKDHLARLDAAADAHAAGMRAQESAFRTLESEGVKAFQKAGDVLDRAASLFGGSK